MATSVTSSVEIEIADDIVITCRPLKIKLLREFMKEFAKMDEEGVREDNDKALAVLMKCGYVAMKQYRPDTKLSEIEELFDLPTLYKVIEIASGIKMDGGDEGNGAAALGMI